MRNWGPVTKNHIYTYRLQHSFIQKHTCINPHIYTHSFLPQHFTVCSFTSLLSMPIFVSNSGCVLYMSCMLLDFTNAFKSREIDPKRRHPVYCYVMTKLLLRGVIVLFACT